MIPLITISPSPTRSERFILYFHLYSSIIELYSFLMEIKVVRNVILNKIDFHDQPSRMHRSPSRGRQKCSDSKKRKKKQMPLVAPPNIMGI